MSHRKSGSISPGTQQVLSKKVSLYIRGHDSKDTIGSGKLELSQRTLKPQQKMGNDCEKNTRKKSRIHKRAIIFHIRSTP